MKRKTMLLFIILPLSLACAGFFASTEAQYYNEELPQSEQIKHVYMINNPLQHIFSLLQRINPLLQPSQHAAADESVSISIPRETIVRFLDESDDFAEFTHKVRISLITSLIHAQYPNFNNRPYQEGNNAIVVQSGNFNVFRDIEEKDNLDTLLAAKLSLFQPDFNQIKRLNKHLEFTTIDITAQEYQDLGTLFLFKDEQDLRDLGYELISRKTRINTDPSYRRHNIKTAFANIGNVRLIMPGEIFSLANEFHYSSAKGGAPYVSGYATFGNGARMVYGGGLCGVATAFFQGTLTNLGLALLEYKAHSIYYRNLYEAEINGIMIKDPGLDATVYASNFDVKVKNIRDYPIIVAFNFDGLSGSVEQVLTLSNNQDRGSFEYIGTYRSGKLHCFTRKINGNNMTNCYNAIRNF